jgi:hypothetical protein
VRFPNHFRSVPNGFRVTRAKAGGNAGEPRALTAEISAAGGINCRAIAGGFARKGVVLPGFRDGTGFAQASAWK